MYDTYRYGGPRHRNDCDSRKKAYKKVTTKTNSPTYIHTYIIECIPYIGVYVTFGA